MNIKLKTISAFALGLIAANTAFGYAKSMYPYTQEGQGAALGCEIAQSGKELELNKWYTNFSVVKKYAEDNGIPMLAIWSNHSCIHCWYTDVCFIQDSYKEWAANNNAGQILYCYMAGGDDTLDQSGSSAYYWMWHNKSLKAYPFVALYWKVDGKVKVEKHMTGDDFCSKGGTALSFTDATIPTRVANIISTLEETFADWDPVRYSGGYFSTTDDDPLEVEPDTESLFVPLYRTATVATNQTIGAVRGSKTLLTSATGVEVAWEEGVTNLVVEIPNFTKYYSSGATITLQLYDEAGEEVVSTATVECVEEQENSPSNPYWIGERTASTLNAGEWTMDLDVALERTAAQTGDAYTMVMFTGGLWCPWCRGIEHYVLTNSAFTAVAQSKNISLVCIDNPRRGAYDAFSGTNTTKSVSAAPFGKPPALLRYATGKSGNSTASGVSYLSRKGIAPEDAETVLQRNHDLGYIGGTYASPDVYRTGYPTCVLLDKSGSIVGRWEAAFESTKDSDARYPADPEESVALLEDLLATASAEREANRYATTTDIAVKVGLGTNVTLSATAPEQSILVENIPSGKVSFYMVSNDSDEEISFTLSRLEKFQLERKDVDGEVVSSEEVYMPVSVVAATSASSALVQEFSAADATYTYVLTVSASGLAAGTTPFSVSIGTSPVLTPEEKSASYTPVSGQVALEVVEGEVYNLTGSWKDLETSFTASNGLYVANESYRAILSVTAGEEISYQIWHPGTVGFAASSKSVKEDAGSVSVAIQREGGVSGTATLTVALDEEATDLYDSDGTAKFSFEPFTVTWNDGDGFSTNAVITVIDDVRYDGPGNVVLTLTLTDGDAELATSTYTLTVAENDIQSPGRAAFVGADPFFSAKSTVYAKESAGATVRVGRIEASDGAVTVKVSSSLSGTTVSGDAEDGVISWGTHKFEEKSVTVTGVPAGKRTTLRLASPTGGLKVLTASNRVTVVSVPDTAPEFASSEEELSIYRYVAISNVYPLVDAPSGRVTFAKTFGRLPAGLKVAYDPVSNAMALYGATTAKAGTYTVVYRAKDGSVAGLTLQLTITVTDPTDVKNNPDLANSVVSATRTFKDIPIVNPVSKRLAGLLQLTIPAKGNISAKYACEWGTISFSCRNWSEFDASSKELDADIAGKSDYQLHVSVQDDGDVDVVVDDPHYEGIALDASTSVSNIWTKANPATDWVGYYTVALACSSVDEDTEGIAPRGAGYLTLKMTESAAKSGKVTWAGVLPNGKAISGSSVLSGGKEWATLPAFKVSSTETLSVLAKILAGGYASGEARSVLSADDVDSCWVHAERDEEAKSDYIVDFNVYGGPYRSDIDLAACCQSAYETTSPTMVFDVTSLGATYYGTPTSSPTTTLVVGEKTLALASGSPSGMSLSLNRSTGIVSGRVKVPCSDTGRTISAQWKGVLLQGWGPDCSDCSPTGGSTDYRPFVNGSYYFSDKVTYTNSASRVRTITVKRGGDVSAE